MNLFLSSNNNYQEEKVRRNIMASEKLKEILNEAIAREMAVRGRAL